MAKQTLEKQVVEALCATKATLATAESCTGGLIAHMITNVPGASNCFAGGVVAYSNACKSGLLDVPEGLFTEHGAVSEPVARHMADGARRRLRSS